MNYKRLSRILNQVKKGRNISGKSLLIQSMLVLSACELMGPDRAERIALEPLSVITEEKPENEKANIYGEGDQDQPPLKPIEPEIWEGTGKTIHVHPEKHRKPPVNGKYTLNFEDVDLGEVIKVILGDTLEENYVLSPRVGGRVTLQTSRPLTRAELLPSLEMLLRMNNAALIKGKGVYKIEPAANALRGISAPGMGIAGRKIPSGYQIRIIPLKYVGVKEIQEILKPLMDPKAILRADAARNLLMLAGTSEELTNLMNTIHMFDVDWMKGMSAGLFTLRNTEVDTILNEIEQIMGIGKDGPLAGVFRMVPLERLNAILVITPQPEYLRKAKTWIARLDKLAPDGLGGEGVYVYKVANVVATELAETLNDIFSGKKKNTTKKASLAPGAKAGKVKSRNNRSQDNKQNSNASDISDVRIVPDEVNNALIITASPSEYEAIKGVIKQLDVVPLQVLVDAKIIEVSLGNNLRYGVEWSGRWGTNLTTAQTPSTPSQPAPTPSPTPTDTPNPTPTTTPTPPPITTPRITNPDGAENSVGNFNSISGVANALATYGIFHGFEIEARLNALAANSNLNVISTPSLLVLNNQEGFINVGDRVPIPTSQATNTNSTNNAGTVITNQIQYQDTGVTLKVTPRVNPGGLVIMEIEQTSDSAEVTTTSSLNAPTIRQRKITSTLAVQNGDTIVLGGLIQERHNEGVGGIPILKDLPVIGPLFGVTSKETSRTELIVLMTPKVIEHRQDALEFTRELQRKLTGVFKEYPEDMKKEVDYIEVSDQISEDIEE